MILSYQTSKFLSSLTRITSVYVRRVTAAAAAKKQRPKPSQAPTEAILGIGGCQLRGRSTTKSHKVAVGGSQYCVALSLSGTFSAAAAINSIPSGRAARPLAPTTAAFICGAVPCSAVSFGTNDSRCLACLFLYPRAFTRPVYLLSLWLVVSCSASQWIELFERRPDARPTIRYPNSEVESSHRLSVKTSRTGGTYR